MSHSKKLKQQLKNMDAAMSYAEWEEAALEYDRLTGMDDWKARDQTRLYDHVQIRQRLERLKAYRSANDNHGLLYTLNEGIHGNMGGMGRDTLYSHAMHGTKQLITEYVDEICDALSHIAALEVDNISREEKLDFFHRASHCYGRSALMLSGGGSLGHFHMGVLKALIEQDTLPQVISGASAGSVVASIVGTHTSKEMMEFFRPENLVSEAKEEATWFNRMFFGKRPQIDIHDIEETVCRLIPNLTFQEAYEKTGIHINISVAPAELHQTSRLLNAIASPNVYIRKAVMASCAVPGVFPAVTLEAKNVHGESQPYLPTRRWVDGSVTDDLPAKRLARLYGVNHYIGSLINPIVLFTNGKSRSKSKVVGITNALGHRAIAEWTRGLHNFSLKYTQGWPRFNMATGMAYSIFNQKYDADINIFPDFRKFEMRKILSHLTADELLALVRQGELATWEKMEMIKTCSKVSRTLDNILQNFGEAELLHAVKSREMKRKKSQRESLN